MNWTDYIGKVTQGDCLELMKDIPDKSIDLVLTDIPYNISQKSNGLRKLDYGEWDKQSGMEIKWIEQICRVSMGTIIVFCHKTQFSMLYNYAESNNFICRSIVWHKPNPTVINCDKIYIESVEFAVYGKRPTTTFNPTYKHNLFEMQSPQEREHPTQKPIDLFAQLIKDTTKENDIILDPFLGSGTTALACERLNRRWIGMELNPVYVAIAEKRIKSERDQLKLKF